TVSLYIYCFLFLLFLFFLFFFSSRRRHTRSKRDWSSDVCSSDLCGSDRGHHSRREGIGRRSGSDDLQRCYAADRSHRRFRSTPGRNEYDLGSHAEAAALLGGHPAKRLLSFVMVVAVGIILLASLFLSAFLATASHYFQHRFPLTGPVWPLADLGLSFVTTTLLFAAIFKILPDVDIAWRDVWLGAAVTAALFAAGKIGIGLYLGRSSFKSVYGAADPSWCYLLGCITPRRSCSSALNSRKCMRLGMGAFARSAARGF